MKTRMMFACLLIVGCVLWAGLGMAAPEDSEDGEMDINILAPSDGLTWERESGPSMVTPSKAGELTAVIVGYGGDPDQALEAEHLLLDGDGSQQLWIQCRFFTTGVGGCCVGGYNPFEPMRQVCIIRRTYGGSYGIESGRWRTGPMAPDLR